MVVTFSGSLVESCCWEGATLQTNITGVCGKCSQGFCCPRFGPAHRVCPFILPFSTSMLLCRELSEVGLGLHTFPRFKLLSFMFLDTPQRRRLGWACVWCPLQVWAAQVTRCLASAVTPGRQCVLSPPPSLPLLFWVYNGRTFSCVPCVSSGELISGSSPPSRCWPSRIPSSLG